MWFCDICIKVHKSGFEKIPSLYDEIIKSREKNLKLANDLYAKVEKFFNKQNNSIEKAKSEILNKNDELKVTYADLLKNNTEKSEKKSDPVVIIEPKNKNQGVNKTKIDIKNKINPNEISFNGLLNGQDGKVIIKVKNKEDTGKIKNIVENNLSENYTVKIPDQKNPRLKVVGLDNKPESDEEICETLLNQNDEFFEDSNEIKVVTVMEIRNRNKNAYYNVIVEVHPKVYNKIMSIEDVRIKYNWNICKVFDAIHIKRCLKCCSFDGHSTKECKNDLICFICSGKHKSEECTADKPHCINCEKYMKNLKINLNCEHNAMSRECAVYQKMIERKKRTINYSQ